MNVLFVQCGCGRTNVAGELVEKIMKDTGRDWAATDTLISALVMVCVASTPPGLHRLLAYLLPACVSSPKVINDNCEECVLACAGTPRVLAAGTHSTTPPTPPPNPRHGSDACRALRLSLEMNSPASSKLLALACLEACMADCVPDFAQALCQKRIPDALATLVLATAADVAVREKSLLLLQTWMAGFGGVRPREGGHHVRILHDAVDRLRLEGVPLKEAAPGPRGREGARREDAFAAWMTQHAAREQAKAAAAAPRGRRPGRRSKSREDEQDILPLGRDGKKKGQRAQGPDEADARDGSPDDGRPRWNVAGRRAVSGPEGDDKYRTGTLTGAARGEDSSDEEEGGAAGGDPGADTDPVAGGSGGAEGAWRTSRQARKSPDGRAPASPPVPGSGRSRVAGLPQSLSSDMADAAMMQEMLALNLRDEGESILEDGDLEGALALFTQAMGYAPNYRLFVARSRVFLRMGRLREAYGDAQQLVALLPSFHVGHSLRGQALEQQGNLTGAATAYDKAAFLAGAVRC
jgi:hypothetical protein